MGDLWQMTWGVAGPTDNADGDFTTEDVTNLLEYSGKITSADDYNPQFFYRAENGPVGEYKLIARRVDGPTFTGTFAVQTYEMPKAILAFDLQCCMSRFVELAERLGEQVFSFQ